jgi:hypothetical protein
MLIDLENCKHCNNYSLKCNDVNNCGDIYHVLNNLSAHFQHIRTILRRLYELRSLNIWIYNRILKLGCLTEIIKILSFDPIEVNISEIE